MSLSWFGARSCLRGNSSYSQAPCDLPYSCWFVGAWALYFHLWPWSFGEGCVRATLRKKPGVLDDLHAAHGPSYILYVGKCKASAGHPNVQRRRKFSGTSTIVKSTTSGSSRNDVGWAPWWALLHKICVIMILILALLSVLWSGAFEVSVSLGCIDFSLMPEGYASEI
jgi:hypothetical protein